MNCKFNNWKAACSALALCLVLVAGCSDDGRTTTVRRVEVFVWDIGSDGRGSLVQCAGHSLGRVDCFRKIDVSLDRYDRPLGFQDITGNASQEFRDQLDIDIFSFILTIGGKDSAWSTHSVPFGDYKNTTVAGKYYAVSGGICYDPWNSCGEPGRARSDWYFYSLNDLPTGEVRESLLLWDRKLDELIALVDSSADAGIQDTATVPDAGP